jgi:AsmA protein
MDVSFKGKQSDATNGNYNKLENKGILYLRDIKTTSDYLPKPFIIKEGRICF